MKVPYLWLPYITACLAADIGTIPQARELEKRTEVTVNTFIVRAQLTTALGTGMRQ